jgi:endonuclease III
MLSNTATNESSRQGVSTAIGLATEMHQRLNNRYAVPVIHQSDRLGPVSQLISSLIANRTSADRADRAFRNLCGAYWSWREIRDAPIEAIHLALVDVDPSGRKAAIISNALKAISEWSSWRHPSLDYLADYADDDAISWLCRIEGVTANIAAEALLLSTLRRAILPVDLSHQRVAQRAGLIPVGLPADEAQADINAMLPNQWRPSDFEAHYFLVRAHAQKYCLPHRPKCGPCPLRDTCRFGMRSLAPTGHP